MAREFYCSATETSRTFCLLTPPRQPFFPPDINQIFMLFSEREGSFFPTLPLCLSLWKVTSTHVHTQHIMVQKSLQKILDSVSCASFINIFIPLQQGSLKGKLNVILIVSLENTTYPGFIQSLYCMIFILFHFISLNLVQYFRKGTI